MLRAFGATTVTTFGNRADAPEWLDWTRPDLAVIDPRLNDGTCADVAERLVADGVPFIIYSGAEVDDPVFRKGGWLDKPTTPDSLQEALQRILS
ncbi:hypothetical protein [Rhizobium populisoli]|uniref:hypothetical protein n=1 Tax=Rhizobium populisoli TaxID=2859785 RepID=UPI001CA5A567|nr:hypothetical protein [Rhizobium populisoli]